MISLTLTFAITSALTFAGLLAIVLNSRGRPPVQDDRDEFDELDEPAPNW